MPPALPRGAQEPLRRLLTQSQQAGFLGPGPVDSHIDHSLAFVEAWTAFRPVAPARVLDLGSGGGVPGLVLLAVWPHAEFVLLDSQRRRAELLVRAIEGFAAGGRAGAVLGRAEELARGPRREWADLVTARGFGPPAVTAECGVGFLHAGGILAVADPPGAPPERWPRQPLQAMGLSVLGAVTHPAAVTTLERGPTLDPALPRRTGVPAKRPRWRTA